MFIPIRDHNPTVRPPIVTVGLIAVNVIVFLITLVQPDGGDEMVWTYGFVPAKLKLGTAGVTPDKLLEPASTTFRFRRYVDVGAEVEDAKIHSRAASKLPGWLNLVTCMFLHAGWLHVIGNMWFLWIFGNNIEDRCGHLLFTIFYLVTGVAGSFTHYLVAQTSVVPTIGASGAISGVLGAYIILFPHAQVDCLMIWYFIQMIRIRAVWFLGVWMGLQVLSGLMGQGGVGGGVAYFAHIGGFAAGCLLIKLFDRGPPLEGPRVWSPPPERTDWRSEREYFR